MPRALEPSEVADSELTGIELRAIELWFIVCGLDDDELSTRMPNGSILWFAW